MVDLGLAAKVRPCLLLTDWPADDELALTTVLAHTRSIQERERLGSAACVTGPGTSDHTIDWAGPAAGLLPAIARPVGKPFLAE